MDRIIFLDIDGVLNSQHYFRERKKDNRSFPIDDLDPKAIEMLNSLIENTKAKIVISSSWRLLNSRKDKIAEYLSEVGFKYPEAVIGITPDLHIKGMNSSIPRGCEIREWLYLNYGYDYDQKMKYVIIDDDSDMLLWQSQQYFQCDGYAGLTPNICYRIVRFFEYGIK